MNVQKHVACSTPTLGRIAATVAYLCVLALSKLAMAMFHSDYDDGQSTGILHGRTRFGPGKHAQCCRGHAAELLLA